jgi:tetrahydromethanopterin S-methyltransferase subunit A
MQLLGRLMPQDPGGERAAAVRMIRHMEVAKDWLRGGPLQRRVRRLAGGSGWPPVPGAYAVGDPAGTVAVCTLTSNDLMAPCAQIPGVAIAGRVYTVNLGIEKIIQNVTGNPAIRFLVLCGKESPVFQPAQGLRALFDQGVTAERRINGALGHLPVLDHIPAAQIEAFRQQVELIDRTSLREIASLRVEVAALVARRALPIADAARWAAVEPVEASNIVRLPPGGGGAPIEYDATGFWIFSLDRDAGQIVARHHLPDNTPAHEIRARTADGILQSIVLHRLVSQTDHAGYLGIELAKAEAALRFGFRYEQDQHLRRELD